MRPTLLVRGVRSDRRALPLELDGPSTMSAFLPVVLGRIEGVDITASRPFGTVGLPFVEPADFPRAFGLCEILPFFFDGVRDASRLDVAARLPGDDLAFFAEVRFEGLRTERFFKAMGRIPTHYRETRDYT